MRWTYFQNRSEELNSVLMTKNQLSTEMQAKKNSLILRGKIDDSGRGQGLMGGKECDVLETNVFFLNSKHHLRNCETFWAFRVSSTSALQRECKQLGDGPTFCTLLFSFLWKDFKLNIVLNSQSSVICGCKDQTYLINSLIYVTTD